MTEKDVYLCQKTICENQAGPLAGKTFVVKDFTQVKGLPLTFGLKEPLIKEAKEHSAIVQKLLLAGAIFKGTTNLDVAALGYSGKNPYYGSITHPLYPQKTIPGSSFGAAAAVLKDEADFALGSDLAGSIRLPAAACKLWGLKLSPNSAPRQGSILYDYPLDCFGLITRELSLLKVLVELFNETHIKSEISTIYTPSEKDLSVLSKSSKDDFTKQCSLLKDLGFTLKELPKDYFSIYFSKRNEIYPQAILNTLKEQNISDPAIEELKASLQILTKQKPKTDSYTEHSEQLKSILSDSIIISPTLPGTSDPEHPSLNFFSVLANAEGCPSLTVPLPTGGMQLISASEREGTLINIASRIMD